MKKLAMLLFVLALCVPAADAAPVVIDLGTAGDFAVLAGSGVTSTGATVINGDVGSYPTPAIVGFPPGKVYGTLYRATNSATRTAKDDLVVAYNAVVAAPDGNTDETVDLAGRTLDPNVYAIGDADFSAGTLTLDANGDANAQWIFHTNSLTTANNFNVALTDGASASNVFWQVGTSATIGDNNFAGNILAMTTITFAGGTTLNGRALARNGAVTFSGPVDINIPGYVPGDANVSSNAILVYKVTTAINPEITYADLNGLEGDVSKRNLSAYVVFSVDMDGYVVQLPSDVNDTNGPTAVVFGKDGRDKFQITLRDNEIAHFVSIDTFGSDASIEPFEVTNKRNTYATSVGINFGDSNETTGFDIGISLYGKNTSTNIGQAGKRSVAKSLKGQVWFERGGQFVEGWGDAKATLDSKLTKDANKNNQTMAETVDYIQTTVLKKYTVETVLP
jgi:hypothetical protein